MLEAQVRPLVVAILRFIQLGMPLLLLKLMAQSRRGVIQILEAIIPPTKITQGTREIHLSKAQRINTHNLNFC
jgi:hypothetical protein